MFYNHKSYQVISEKKMPDNLELQKNEPEFYEKSPEFWEIECQNLNTYDHCPHCKKKTVTKKGSSHKFVYEYNERKKRIEKVGVSSQRYRCTTCKKTFNAESTVDDITYTKDFERSIASLMLVEQFSSTLLGEKYERSHKFISNIVHRYTSNMLLGFTPPQECEALCLYPFMYQRKQRYFLAHYTIEKKWQFTCFFGHIDAMKEIRNYFSFQVNSELTISKPVLLTDYDEDLIRLLTDVLGEPKLAFIRELMESRLEPLKYAISVDDENEKATSIIKFIDIVFGTRGKIRKDLQLSIEKKTKTLNSWKAEVKKSSLLSKSFAELLDKLKKYEEYVLRSKQYDEFIVELKELREQIEDFNGSNVSFDIMTATMMSWSYKNYAFNIDCVDMFMTPDNYDEVSETYYRQPLEEIPVAKIEEKHDHDSDEATAQLEGILSLIEEEKKAKLYYTFEDGDDPPFGPL